MSGTLDNVTSWLPIGETPEEITLDATNLIGPTTLNGFAYGIVFTLYIICVHSLFQQRRSGIRIQLNTFTIIYISVMFSMATIYCAVNSRLVQLEFVDFRNYPGGPTEYSFTLFDLPLNIVGLVAFFITNWMNDALLLWRLWVLYNSSRFQPIVVSIGGLLYLATFVIGMITVIDSSLPNQSFFTGIAIRFVTTYYSLTTSFTIIITLLMTARIYTVRRRVLKATGSSGFASQYTSIVAMLIESSALYTIWGIIFLVLYVVDNPVQNIFLATLSEVQTIAPLLIVYRVSKGKGWHDDTSKMLSTNTSTLSTIPSAAVTMGNTRDTELRTIRINVHRDIADHHESTASSKRDDKRDYTNGAI